MREHSNAAAASGAGAGLPVLFCKDEYGFFIYTQPGDWITNDCPSDLKGLIEFARTHNCEWLCIDTDGPEVPMVPTYGD